MATIYCNLNTGSGLKKLNEYLLHRSYSTRQVSSSSSFFLFKSQTFCNCSYETLICVVFLLCSLSLTIQTTRYQWWDSSFVILLSFQTSNDDVSAATEKTKKRGDLLSDDMKYKKEIVVYIFWKVLRH